jgi:hypothetical protein
MQVVEVNGRFVNDQREPITGRIKFIPSQIWVDEGEETYVCFAPEVELVEGRFKVYLTRTDQHGLPWHYTVICPMGKWSIKVEHDGPIALKDLLPKKLA